MIHVHVRRYTTATNVARARTHFFNGRVQFLLLTERFHFFRRYLILREFLLRPHVTTFPRSPALIASRFVVRGMHNLVFYKLPDHPQFYTEFVNMLPGCDNSCLVLFSKFDAYQLERIVGAGRCERMMQSPKDSHMLV